MRKQTADLHGQIASLSDGVRTVQEIADAVGRSKSYVQALIHTLGLPKVKMPKGFAHPGRELRQRSAENQQKVQEIIRLSDGTRTSKDIAAAVGVSAKYVQAICSQYNLDRLPRGAQPGASNPSYAGGRHIDLDGYVLVSAPRDHPHAKAGKGKNVGRIFEHRLVMERKIGRYLEPTEVVDHIDGLRLHNSAENLRLFASNRDHLRATISGQRPAWSAAGFQKMQIPSAQRPAHPRVDRYSEQRKHGDVRLQQILLAWLSLGKDSPYLLGSHRWLERSGISDLSRPSLELHLQMLFQKWGQSREE